MSVKEIIEEKLSNALNPVYLEILDESYMHSSGPGAESHFKVTVVTDAFDTLSLIKRHREINRILADELNSSIHALAIHAHTSSEWERKGNQVPDSPACMGGSKR